jgi:hypothetical protein
MPLFGKRFPFPQSGCEITTLGSIKSFFVISTPTRSCTSKKNGKGETNDAGEAFHIHNSLTPKSFLQLNSQQSLSFNLIIDVGIAIEIVTRRQLLITMSLLLRFACKFGGSGDAVELMVF